MAKKNVRCGYCRDSGVAEVFEHDPEPQANIECPFCDVDAVSARPKFTPGPWHPGAGNGTGCVFSANGRMRLEVGGTTLSPVANCLFGWNKEEDEANGLLIAAAPDLFALAERIARLNRDAGEIGAGMLAQLVDEANRVITLATRGVQ